MTLQDNRHVSPDKFMKMINVYFPLKMLHAMDSLVLRGFFPNRAELIRHSVVNTMLDFQEILKGENP